MSQSALAHVTATITKEDLAILEASDDRELMAQGQNDFLPYDFAFKAVVELIEVRPKKNHDSRGVFVTLKVLKVLETESPGELKEGKSYTLAFFDAHKTIPEYVIGQMVLNRRAFAAALAGETDSDDFKAAPVLLQLVKEVEPLGIRMVVSNVFQRKTRTGKAVHRLEYALPTS